MGSSREDRKDEGPRLASPLPFPGFSLVPSPTPVSAGFSGDDNWSSDNCKCRNNSSFRVGDYHGSSNHNGSSYNYYNDNNNDHKYNYYNYNNNDNYNNDNHNNYNHNNYNYYNYNDHNYNNYNHNNYNHHNYNYYNNNYHT